MLNFEEELKKFTPIMEVDDIEEALYREDFTADTGRTPAPRRENADQEDRRR